MMSIALQVMSPDTSLDILDLRARRRDAALAQLVQNATTRGAVRDPEMLVALLQRHERAVPAAIGKGVALPNAHSLTVLRPMLVCGRAARGIEWPGAEDEPVSLVLLTLSPAEWTAEHHYGWVAHVAHAVRLQRTRQRLLDAADAASASDVLRGALA